MLLEGDNGTRTSCDAKLRLLSCGSLRIREGKRVGEVVGTEERGTGNGLALPGFRVSWGLVAVIPFGRECSGGRGGLVGCTGR